MDEVKRGVDECYEDLANAVVMQAVKDYRKLKKAKTKSKGDYITQIERMRLRAFFTGEWFRCLSDLNGREILRRLDKELIKK